jgi:cyanuric acid amidohydrolase
MPRQAQVFRLPMSGPDDVSGIVSLISDGKLDPQQIIAILGKTEGNGCVNDFTRGYATQSLRAMLASYLGEAEIARIPLVMSGGTEGGLSPHWIVFSRIEGTGSAEAGTDTPALAMAGVITRPLDPREIGRNAQAELVRAAVLEAMVHADITGPDDVHFVQIKCPLLTAERANSVGGDVATDNMLKSMGLSRGASALGVALALGEVATITDAQIGTDMSLWSSRASCSAGIELMACEIIILGLSQRWSGPLRIGHEVMQDAIDAPAVARLLAQAAPGAPLQEAQSGLVAVLAKAEASSSGQIRGNRHTMLEDSDISSTRHARGFVGGMLAGLVGHTELFVSGGAEHQGPDGGGPVAIIYTSLKGTDA